MTVYLDVIFVLNFMIDASIIAVTAWTRKLAVKAWRLAAAAAIGAIYVVMMLFPNLTFMFTFMLKIIFSIVMIMTAFGFGGLQHFLRNAASFYFVNFVFAGGIFAIHYLMQTPGEVMNGLLITSTGGAVNKIGILFLVSTFIILLGFYKGVIRSSERQKTLTKYMAEVCVTIDGQHFACNGLIDTGNRLYDPLTRIPVMIMEASAWIEHFPPSWMNLLRQAEADKIISLPDVEQFRWHDRLRLVPYRAVNGKSQFMLALKPDKVVIRLEDRTFETERVLVGIDGGSLASDGSYRAIIHPTLVEQLT